MKPNDKAYQAAILAIKENGPYYAGSKIREDMAKHLAEVALPPAFAAQFNSEEYAGLVENLRRDYGFGATGDDCLAAADAIEAQAKEIIGLDSQLRDSHEMTCHQDARIAELEAENAKLRTLLLNLADAADGVGVKHFDTDSFSDEVEEMRLSTLAAREELKKPAQL